MSTIPTRVEATFVVVGAHRFGAVDEENDNPFFTMLAGQRRWRRVLLLEANPGIARELRRRFRNSVRPFWKVPAEHIHVSNTAVCPHAQSAKRIPFYSVTARTASGDARLPSWADQFSSFNRTHVSKLIVALAQHMTRTYGAANNWTVDALEASVRRYSVHCRTVADVLTDLRFPPPAVLSIDTEGADCSIVADLDLCRVQPKLLQFEHDSCARSDRSKAINHLVSGRCSRFAPPARLFSETYAFEQLQDPSAGR